MVSRQLVVAIVAALVSTAASAQTVVEPVSVLEVHEEAEYYEQREVAVSGFVVDSHLEWYSESSGDYMTWNLLISDVTLPGASDSVLLGYESGFNTDQVRECHEIAEIHKELGHQVIVVGEYDSAKDILNLRKFIYFEEGEAYELDTDVNDREQVRIYTDYGGSFDYDIHYTVWHRHRYIWPHPIWWVWWEPTYFYRPPVRYVVYHTPWRTYRHRRIHPRIRVRPLRRRRNRIGRPGNIVRVNPRPSSRRLRTTSSRMRRERLAHQRIRVTPRRSRRRLHSDSPRQRIRTSRSSPSSTRVRPERRINAARRTRTRPARPSPGNITRRSSSRPTRTHTPSRTRLTPRQKSVSSSSARRRIRSAPSRPSVSSRSIGSPRASSRRAAPRRASPSRSRSRGASRRRP